MRRLIGSLLIWFALAAPAVAQTTQTTPLWDATGNPVLGNVRAFWSGTLSTSGATFGYLPARAAILAVIIRESAGHAVNGGLNIGTAVAGAQIASAVAVGANSYTILNGTQLVAQHISDTGKTALYATPVTGWASANVTIEIIYAN